MSLKVFHNDWLHCSVLLGRLSSGKQGVGTHAWNLSLGEAEAGVPDAKVSHSYIASMRPAWATRDPVSKTTAAITEDVGAAEMAQWVEKVLVPPSPMT